MNINVEVQVSLYNFNCGYICVYTSACNYSQYI